LPPFQPTPLFAALVAPAFRNPCADLGTPAALQAPWNHVPKLSFTIGLPSGVAMNASGPVVLASMTSQAPARLEFQPVPVFSVRSTITPSRTCWRPRRRRRHALGQRKAGSPELAVARTYGPAGFETLYFFLAPRVEAFSAGRRSFNALGRIGSGETGFESPAEKPAHRFQEAANGVALRRSRAAKIVLRVIFANGSSPADSMA